MDKIVVKVLYFAELSKITKIEKENFELSGYNLEDLLKLMFKKYISLKDLILDKKTQKIHNNISLIINNQPIHNKNPSTIHLNHKDTIAFLQPVSGG